MFRQPSRRSSSTTRRSSGCRGAIPRHPLPDQRELFRPALRARGAGPGHFSQREQPASGVAQRAWTGTLSGAPADAGADAAADGCDGASGRGARRHWVCGRSARARSSSMTWFCTFWHPPPEDHAGRQHFDHRRLGIALPGHAPHTGPGEAKPQREGSWPWTVRTAAVASLRRRKRATCRTPARAPTTATSRTRTRACPAVSHLKERGGPWRTRRSCAGSA